MSQCSHMRLLARSTNWTRKKEGNALQQHIVRTGFLMPEHNKGRSTRTSAHAGQGARTQSRSRSKSEVTPPPVHARNMQRACWEDGEEGAEPETDSVLVRGVTGPPVCAKCKCASTPIKRDAGRRSPSERDANERDHDFFSARVCLRENTFVTEDRS